jgi:hypothetical protein
VSGGVFSTPRPVPGRLLPALAGSAVVVLALPVFAVAGWPFGGWALATVLWGAGLALQELLTRLRDADDTLARAGVMGIGMSFRAMAVGIPLVAATVANEAVGLSAALLYALAFTLALAVSLIEYFGAEAKAR